MRQIVKKYILINGYGVPKNIFTDANYTRYLRKVFGYLHKNYYNQALLILLLGGPTATQAPFNRTEADEMKKWFMREITQRGFSRLWSVHTIKTKISALENLIEAKKVVGKNPVIYFCEKTRLIKSRRLVGKIFALKSRVVAIDFDHSPARYDTKTRQVLEREDLAYSLRALKSPAFRKTLQNANKEKLRILRTLSPRLQRKNVDKIALEVRRNFLNGL